MSDDPATAMEGTAPLDDTSAFYSCGILGVGLYFKSDIPQDAVPTHPRVLVPDLGQWVDATLCGFGEDGHRALLALGEPYDSLLFPVDMTTEPYRVRPRPTSVSDALYSSWLTLLETLGRPRPRSRCRSAEVRGEPPAQEVANLSDLLALGMTREEVVEAIGQPHDTGGTSRRSRIPTTYKYEVTKDWHLQVHFGPKASGTLHFAHAELNGEPHTHIDLIRDAGRQHRPAVRRTG